MTRRCAHSCSRTISSSSFRPWRSISDWYEITFDRLAERSVPTRAAHGTQKGIRARRWAVVRVTRANVPSTIQGQVKVSSGESVVPAAHRQAMGKKDNRSAAGHRPLARQMPLDNGVSRDEPATKARRMRRTDVATPVIVDEDAEGARPLAVGILRPEALDLFLSSRLRSVRTVAMMW